MVNFLRSLGFRPETVAGFVRGVYQALLNGILAGVLGYLAGGTWGYGVALGMVQFIVALGGRTVEGAFDARSKSPELSPLERDAVDRIRRGQPFSYDPDE